MHTVLRIQIQLKPPQRRPTYGASHFVINLSWWEWVIPYTHMPNMFSCQNKSARCSVWIWCQTFSPDMTAPQVILFPSCSWFTQITFSSALHDCLSFSQSMQKCIKFFCRAATSLFILLPMKINLQRFETCMTLDRVLPPFVVHKALLLQWQEIQSRYEELIMWHTAIVMNNTHIITGCIKMFDLNSSW